MAFAPICEPPVGASTVAGADQPVTLASKRIKRPNERSLEYRLSWGIGAIGAGDAFRKGATGSGIVVAMIDTGTSRSASTIVGSLSGDSTDLIVERKDLAVSRHGEQTAGVLGGAFDGNGTMGVAYGATVLSIRSDLDGSCKVECAVKASDLGRALDYAVDHRARVIGIPLVGNRALPVIEPALRRAVASGAIIVAAAGNSARADPSWPARYAAMAPYSESMIVAGASTIRGDIAPWSSKAGIAQHRYLAAPGENVLVDCDRKYCHLVSGTSYSVAYVAGALALLLDRYPTISGRVAAAILLDSARDRARSGADVVVGRGVLDISRAMRLAERRKASL